MIISYNRFLPHKFRKKGEKMSVQDIDDIAKELFQRSETEKKEEKKSSVKKQAYPVEKANAFYSQFREEFNKMYIKTLINLRISRRKNPTLANIVKNDLLKVLSEESEYIHIDPSTHKLDLTNFRNNILKKTRHRIKKIHFRSELEAADKNPEIVTSSTNPVNGNEKTIEKETFSLDKFLENYNSLSTRQNKLDYIKENIIANENLSDSAKQIVTEHLANYLDYRQFVTDMRAITPDITRQELREFYLSEHPELDRKEFYENTDFAKAYLNLKQANSEYAALLEVCKGKGEDYLQEERNELLEKILINGEIVENFMEKHHLTEKESAELANTLDDSGPENSVTDEEFEQAEGEEFEVDLSGEAISEDDFDGLDIDKFASIYTRLTELQEQYAENPSPELEQFIQQYQKTVDDYIDQNDLSEEDLITIIQNADLEEEFPKEEIVSETFEKRTISSILDDHGSVAEEIRQNQEQEFDETLETSMEIKENPIIQFFRNIQNRFSQKSLPSGQTALNLEDSAKPKTSFFSKIKNTFSRLSNLPNQKTSAIENTTVSAETKSNAWDLSDEKRQALQIGAKQIAEEMQNRPKSEKPSSVIETDQSLLN